MPGGPQDLLILPGVWGSDVILDGIPFFQRRAHWCRFQATPRSGELAIPPLRFGG
jgi:hypothetical protein